MTSKLDPRKAIEGSTFTIVVEFNEKLSDDSLNPVVPNSGIVWSLHDGKGNPINSRQDIPIDPPAQTVMITLSGDDLKTFPGKATRRYVTVQGTYSGTAGNNLPFIDEVSFQIENLIGV